MDQHKSLACSVIDGQNTALEELNKRIYGLAEPGGKATKSNFALKKFLKSHGFKVTSMDEVVAGAWRAEFGPGEHGGAAHPHLVVVARCDAVRGKGHVLGNNLSAVVAAGVGLGVATVIQASTAKVGRVTVLGVPDSTNGGCIELLNRQAFKGVDLAVEAVAGPRTEWNPQYLCTKTFRCVFNELELDVCGKEVRAKRDMFLVNPLDGAVLTVNNINNQRNDFHKDWKVDCSIRRGGVKPDVKVTEAEVMVKVTAKQSDQLSQAENRIKGCWEGAREAAGGGLDVSMGDRIYFSLVPAPSLYYLLQLNAYNVGVLPTPLETPRPLPPADSASISRRLPMLRPMFYIHNTAERGTQEFKEAVATKDAHYAAISMAKALATTALDAMRCRGVLGQARREVAAEVARQRTVPTTATAPATPDTTQKRYQVPKAVPYDCVGWSKK